MRRLPVLSLVALGWLGLSCQVAGLVSGAGNEPAMPAVAVQPETTTSEPDSAEQADPSSEAGILAELRSRHTALADHELVRLARTIVAESQRHDFDPALVMAVIHVESGGYHLAVSHVGAMGLMQLMPPTGEALARRLAIPWQGPDTLFDPQVNVRLGVAYLRELTDRYDNVPTALAAYNWGPGRIDRRLRRGATVPSRYIEQVMRAYDVPSPPTDRG